MRRALAILAIVICGVTFNHFSQPAHAAEAPFQRIFTANFNGQLNRRVWTVYNGTPSCCNSLWAPAAVSTSGGGLTIDASLDSSSDRWTSGGISMGRRLNQTYGAWSFRFRMDPGVGVKMCGLLWPRQGWPPEIDFAESSSADANRRELSSTLHYGSSNSMLHRHLAVDHAAWHTMAVRWTPRRRPLQRERPAARLDNARTLMLSAKAEHTDRVRGLVRRADDHVTTCSPRLWCGSGLAALRSRRCERVVGLWLTRRSLTCTAGSSTRVRA